MGLGGTLSAGRLCVPPEARACDELAWPTTPQRLPARGGRRGTGAGASAGVGAGGIVTCL